MTASLMPLAAFVAVIALIPLALWTMKRAGVGTAHGADVLRPVAQLAVGSAQRVVVVEVAVGSERHWLVLGVAGDQVSRLESYPAPDLSELPAAPAHAMAVNQLINRWRGGAGASEGKRHD
jgi:flagellar protein FliO/FliZ